MIPVCDVPEQSFGEMEELLDAIAGQDRKVHEVPIRDISLSEDGVLRAGGFEGHMTKSAFCGLVSTEGAPADFVVNHCPEDLQVAIVERLAREANISVLVQTVDGVATGVMPADRRPIRYDVLMDRLGADRHIEEATLSGDCLRITAANDEPRELLPNDPFRSGWELMTSENGWRPTRVSQWLEREICRNGAVEFGEAAVFKRACNSREPVLVSLQGLVHVLENAVPSVQLGPAIRWAADTPVGEDRKLVVDYLSRRLGGDATKRELGDVTADASWYQMMNAVTSLAQIHGLELRRRYEAEGGMLLRWFSRRGRTRPPWRRVSCEGCEDWNVGSTDAGTSRNMVAQRVDQIRE